MRSRGLLSIAAVLTLVACAHAPPAVAPTAAPDPAVTLPPLPATIPSVLGPITVEMMDSLPVAAPPGVVILGAYLAHERRVLIRRGLPLPEAWEVLLHERCHVELHDAGLGFPPAVADHICDTWGTADVRDLRSGALGFAAVPP